MTAAAVVTCATCGAACKPEGCATGYGVAPDGSRHCFDCCATRERARMIETGRAVLYLVAHGYGSCVITDWPGKLRFHGRVERIARHGGGFGSQITTARFTGPDGRVWSAVNRGDSQIARCRRLVRP